MGSRGDACKEVVYSLFFILLFVLFFVYFCRNSVETYDCGTIHGHQNRACLNIAGYVLTRSPDTFTFNI